MFSSVRFRIGDAHDLANEYSEFLNNRTRLKYSNLDAGTLDESKILAVHFASAGAQGDAGGVEILYCDEQGIKSLYGNYCYGNLDSDILYKKLPLLKNLDGRRSIAPPYPFGGEIELPDGWLYDYMGYINHFFIREEINNRASEFLGAVVNNEHTYFLLFDSLAWLCQAEYEEIY